MRIKKTLSDGIDVLVSLSYTPKPALAGKVTVVAEVVVYATGAVNSGKTIAMRGDGAFVFDESYTLPVIGNSTYREIIARKEISGIVPVNQTYGMTVMVNQGSDSATYELAETIYIGATTVPEPTNLKAVSVNDSLALLSWVNQSTYSKVVITHYSENHLGEMIYENTYELPGSNTSHIIEVGNNTRYHEFVVCGHTDVVANQSRTVSVKYRKPMLPANTVKSRIYRTGILVTWVDPNPENTGKAIQYRLNVSTSDGYTASVLIVSDQRQYYFANLPQGRNYTFTVTVIDQVTGASTSPSIPSDSLFLVFAKYDGATPYDYRLGSLLVRALYVGDKIIWSRA